MLRLSLAFGRGELIKLLLTHRAIHFLGGALKAAGAGLSAFGSERSTRGFLLGSRFGWHVELPSLVAGRGVLTRWLVDFLRLVFGLDAARSAARRVNSKYLPQFQTSDGVRANENAIATRASGLSCRTRAHLGLDHTGRDPGVG